MHPWAMTSWLCLSDARVTSPLIDLKSLDLFVWRDNIAADEWNFINFKVKADCHTEVMQVQILLGAQIF